MKKRYTIITMLVGIAPLLFAGTNATIEVKLFKTWGIAGEEFSYNLDLAIKNTGTDPILLAKNPVYFEAWQLAMRPLPHKPDIEENEKHNQDDRVTIGGGTDYFFELPVGETHVYEGRRLFLVEQMPFSETMHFTISVYLGKGFWLDSEPMTFKGVVPDSEEHIATLTDANGSRDLVAVTYKNERWLYTKSTTYWPVCPISLTNTIRVEPHEGKGRLYKIWDGDKSMIYQDGTCILLEGPDENNVFGKWTRERKQKAEADNAEVRRKKAEEQE